MNDCEIEKNHSNLGTNKKQRIIYLNFVLRISFRELFSMLDCLIIRCGCVDRLWACWALEHVFCSSASSASCGVRGLQHPVRLLNCRIAESMVVAGNGGEGSKDVGFRHLRNLSFRHSFILAFRSFLCVNMCSSLRRQQTHIMRVAMMVHLI